MSTTIGWLRLVWVGLFFALAVSLEALTSVLGCYASGVSELEPLQVAGLLAVLGIVYYVVRAVAFRKR